MKNSAGILCAALVCAILTVGCGDGDKPEMPAKKGGSGGESQTPHFIEIALSDARVSDGAWIVDAQFDLVVDEVKVHLGQDVKKGDLVFTGNYAAERGSTAQVIAKRKGKVDGAQATYDGKAEEGLIEIEELEIKIEERSDELLTKKDKLAELEELKNKAEEVAEEAMRAYAESIANNESEELRKSKRAKQENAEMALGKVVDEYYGVYYAVSGLESDVDNIKRRKSGIEDGLKNGSYARDEWDKLQRAQASYNEIQERIKQTEFKAGASGRVVAVEAKKGDHLSVRTRVALLVDPAKFEISAQVILAQAGFIEKDAEVDIQLQVGEEKVSCKAVVVSDPEPYSDDKKTVRLALKDCATRAKAEDLITKAELDRKLGMKVSLKIK